MDIRNASLLARDGLYARLYNRQFDEELEEACFDFIFLFCLMLTSSADLM